jgi:hypothetical protein
MIPRFHHAVQCRQSRVDAPEDRLGCSAAGCSPAAPPKRRASATGQRFGGCFDEHVVQRGYALTLPQFCDDDAKVCFRQLRTCYRIGSGQQCATSGLMHRNKRRAWVAMIYSITSSARASSVGGTSRPSALAVLKLMANSNLVGCNTGRLAGFSPLRMRPTYVPAS